MRRILFVDDESNVLDGIRRMLYSERGRWEMKFAVGGEAALRVFEESEGFDVIISDMLMPGMNGVELLRIARDRYPETARLVLSGYAENALANKAATVAHQVINKPCTCADLRAAIEQVCTLKDVLKKAELRAVIGRIGSLPTLSETYGALTRILEEPSASMSEVAEVIERDVALSAKILQLVNSAFFGIAQKVTQIEMAIETLGVDIIRNLALTSDVFSIFKPDGALPAERFEAMQQHAHRTAAIVQLFGLTRRDRDVAVISALLHDIGYLILACKMTASFREAQEISARQNCRFYLAEEQVLGVSHAELGAYLLGLWGIDGQVVEAIAHHHHPTRVPHVKLDATVAVYLADLLAHEIQLHPMDSKGEQMSEEDRSTLVELGWADQYANFREKAEQQCQLPAESAQ